MLNIIVVVLDIKINSGFWVKQHQRLEEGKSNGCPILDLWV